MMRVWFPLPAYTSGYISWFRWEVKDLGVEMSIVEYCGGMAARAVAMVVGTVVSAVGGMVGGDGCTHGTHLTPPNGTFKPLCILLNNIVWFLEEM